MRRRVPLQKLRGSDPTLLEIQVQDLLTRPSGQLEPANLADLFALAELEEPPRSIRSALTGFVKRCSAEIGEIPDGSQLDQFCEEYGAVEAARVPQSLRDLVAQLADRDGRDGARLTALLEVWSAAEPQPFELGAGQVRVQRATAATRERSDRRGDRRERSGRSSGGSTQRKAAAPKRSAPVMDIEKRNFIVDTTLERLSQSLENGLGEAVLIAGIRHRARERFPKLAPFEITQVLNELLKSGRVRKSAGRWMRAR